LSQKHMDFERNYLCVFAQTHPNFRLAELISVSNIYGVQPVFDENEYSKEHPFLHLKFPNTTDEVVKKIANRMILLKGIYELIAEADSYDQLVEKMKQDPCEWIESLNQTKPGFTFRYDVDSFLKKLHSNERPDAIKRFSFLDFKSGRVNLNNSQNVDLEVVIFEDHFDEENFRVFFLKKIAEGNRELLEKYNLKKRIYLGTTALDHEMAFIMANHGKVKPGSIVLDPFAGTCSILVPIAHFKAYAIGFEIDGRVLRGSRKLNLRNKEGTNVKDNFAQYNLGHLCDVLVADILHSPCQHGEYLDAILTDPPYGVREGARRLGDKSVQGEHCQKVNKIAYEIEAVFLDLVHFAAKHLVVGGRLVFWLPTNVTYTDGDVPTNLCLTVIANCEQVFGKWSRRLITLEKIRKFDEKTDVTEIPTIKAGKITSFQAFRDFYFQASQNLGNEKRKGGKGGEEGTEGVPEEGEGGIEKKKNRKEKNAMRKDQKQKRKNDQSPSSMREGVNQNQHKKPKDLGEQQQQQQTE